MAILLNLLFNHVKLGNPPDPSVFAAGAEHGASAVDEDDLDDLEDDGVLNGSTRRPVAGDATPPEPVTPAAPSDRQDRDGRPAEGSTDATPQPAPPAEATGGESAAPRHHAVAPLPRTATP